MEAVKVLIMVHMEPSRAPASGDLRRLGHKNLSQTNFD